LQNFNPCFDKSPVNVAASAWEVVDDPRRLMKKFEFDSSHALKTFVMELLDYQDHVEHHGKLVIQPNEVIVEIYTHTVNDVTNVDKEWADMADDIYEEVEHLSLPQEGDDGFYE
jgi:pterin-4a-carbinolamine dehydratase